MAGSARVDSRVRVFRSRTVYRGRVLTLRVDEVAEPGGVRAEREVVVHPGSVVVLPCLADGGVILVRQFRYAARKCLWELVAGSLNPRETVLAGARRELAEETGYRAQRMRRFLTFYPSPGFLTERMHLVEARGLRPAKARPEPDERIEVGRFRRSELESMVTSGTIQDGKTLVALLWLFKS
ncbi:MAG TPA: NUDIX hydrolase [Terriglobia bacterium]|nr:NUDIX hydrolase [Terriglobia bacterium]